MLIFLRDALSGCGCGCVWKRELNTPACQSFTFPYLLSGEQKGCGERTWLLYSSPVGAKRVPLSRRAFCEYVCLIYVADIRAEFPICHGLIGCWAVLLSMLLPWQCGCGVLESTFPITLCLYVFSLAFCCWGCIGSEPHSTIINMSFISWSC